MMGGGRRVSTTIRDLVALAEPGWSSPASSSQSGIPGGSPFAAANEDDVPRRRPWQPENAVKKKQLAGGGVHPETSLGLLAAVMEPASARLLRVAEPVRAVASVAGVIEAVVAANQLATTSCNGKRDTTTACTRLVPFRVDDEPLLLFNSCELCRRRLDDRAIYLYMDKGFCMPECRYEYFREELHEKRKLERAAETPASRRAWRQRGKASLDTDTLADRSGFKRIFFVSDDPEPFGHSPETATSFSSYVMP